MVKRTAYRRIAAAAASILFGIALSFCMAGCALFLGPARSVAYKANGATSGTAPVDDSVYRKGDEATLLSEGALSKTGHWFGGWSLHADGSGDRYAPGDSIEIGTEDVTLYAAWDFAPQQDLKLGETAALTTYNGSFIYSIVTAAPAGKPESDSAPATYYDYAIYTQAGALQNIAAPESPRAARGTRDLQRTAAVPAQARRDEASRAMEARLLAERPPLAAGARGARSRAIAGPIAVGTLWNDVIIADADNAPHSVDTTCRFVSDHAYFFVDNDVIAAMEPFLSDYGEAFDTLYHVNRAKLGQENDVDGNGKVIVVFSGVISDNLLGYFWSVDKFEHDDINNPLSNEGDIVYLTADAEYQLDQGDYIPATLAHEFQHMIYFDEHYDRDAPGSLAWLNEALSQAAEYFNGYFDNHNSWIASFLETYGRGLSLTHWTSNNYGFGAIFIRYLIDRFGEAVAGELCATDDIGIKAVENATGMGFNALFMDFLKAMVMSGTGDSDEPEHRFTTLNLATVQPKGRGGLLPYVPDGGAFAAGDGYDYKVRPYGLEFDYWEGSFGTMRLIGNSGIAGAAFGLSR